eukprot:Opistho-1_new@47952
MPGSASVRTGRTARPGCGASGPFRIAQRGSSLQLSRAGHFPSGATGTGRATGTSRLAHPGRATRRPHHLRGRIMTTSSTGGTTVGVFETRAAAERAVADLKAAGYRDDQIGLVGPCTLR